VAEATPEPFEHGHRIITDLDPQTGDPGDVHGSIAGDSVTPLAADGATPLLAAAWRHVLGATADVVTMVPTTVLKLTDGIEASKPQKRAIRFKAKTDKEPVENRIFLPAAGSVGDPTLYGARLQVMNAADGGELAEAYLPPDGWSLLKAVPAPSFCPLSPRPVL